MKLISMVPSWTETLIECGADVVARTRFCVHPHDRVKSLSVVGGTKDCKWELFPKEADLLILDRDENPQWMAEQSPLPFFASHVRGIEDMPKELRRLNEILQLAGLAKEAEEFSEILCRSQPAAGSAPWSTHWDEVPGVVKWLRKPQGSGFYVQQIYYVIWKDPWMIASRDTFIGSVLNRIGLGLFTKSEPKPYPQVNLPSLLDQNTLCLFSTEPFPFHKKEQELLALPGALAIVDGESFSWFGVRSRRFLQSALKSNV